MSILQEKDKMIEGFQYRCQKEDCDYTSLFVEPAIEHSKQLGHWIKREIRK